MYKKENDDFITATAKKMENVFNQAIAEELDGEPYHETYIRLLKEVVDTLQVRVKKLADGNE